MFTSSGSSVLQMFFRSIWQVANFTLPGLSLTLWQVFTAFIMISVVLKLGLKLANTMLTDGISYRGSSYHKQSGKDSNKDD